MLTVSADDRTAECGLTELQDFHFRHLRDGLQARDMTKVQSYWDSLNASFPSISSVPRYQQSSDQIAALSEAQALVVQGDEYFADDKLTSPDDGNALASYRAALAIDEGNPQAQAGIQRLVGRYVELTQAQIENKQWMQAIDMANRGLALSPNNTQLNRLHKNASEQQDKQRAVDNLLSDAEKLLEDGQLISPRNNSAYFQFQQVLSQDRGNSRAQRGLAEVERQLGYQVETAINASDFELAQEILRNAGQLYPNSERFLALRVSLERSIEADFIARQPKVPQMLVSNTMPSSISQLQQDSLKVDRTLYIGFSYANFNSATSVVHAVLYDGSRTIQIAQVPVVVSGEEGVKFFPIERPVDGFAAGGYNIDLMLNQDRLSTLAFRVERGD